MKTKLNSNVEEDTVSSKPLQKRRVDGPDYTNQSLLTEPDVAPEIGWMIQ